MKKLSKKEQSFINGGSDACYDLDPGNGMTWDVVCGGQEVEDAVMNAE